MKKNIKYIVLFIICFISLSTWVHADDFECTNAVTLVEHSQADSTGWRAIYPVCVNWVLDGYRRLGDLKDTYPDARKIGEELVTTTVGSIDGKRRSLAHVPRCDSSDAYIENNMKYYVYYESSRYKVEEEGRIHDQEYNPCQGISNRDSCAAVTYLDESTGITSNPCKWVGGRADSGNGGTVTRTSTANTDSSLARLEILDPIIDPPTPTPIPEPEPEIPVGYCTKKDSNAHYYTWKTGKTGEWHWEWECDPDDGNTTAEDVGHYWASQPQHFCKHEVIMPTLYDCLKSDYYYDENAKPEAGETETHWCKKVTNDTERAIKQRQWQLVSDSINLVVQRSIDLCNFKYHREAVRALRERLGPVRFRQLEYFCPVPFDDIHPINNADDCIELLINARECDDGEVNYAFNCPLYSCTFEDREIQTCTPTFYVNNSAHTEAYCVNPGDPFSQEGGNTAQYKHLTEFNAYDCEYSYSSKDCGFANILIEAAYQNKKAEENHLGPEDKIEYKDIELALRLWGYHSGGSGFEDSTNNVIGLSYRQGAACNNPVGYGIGYNVYEKTYIYLKNHYTEKLLEFFTTREVTFDNYKSGKFHYACPTDFGSDGFLTNIPEARSAKLAVACGDNLGYQKAIALFYNTMNGNKDMKAHLLGLFPGEIEDEVQDVTYNSVSGVNYVYIKFTDPEPLNEKIELLGSEEVVLDCKELRKPKAQRKEAYKKLTDEQIESIMPYCQIETKVYNKFGQEIQVSRYYHEYDGEGNLVLDEEGNPKKILFTSGSISECLKDIGCVTYVDEFAFCEETNERRIPSSIGVKYKRTAMSNSVRKYVACSGGASQIMYAFFDGSTITTETPEPIEEYYDITTYVCETDITGRTLCDDGIVVDSHKVCSTGGDNAYTTEWDGKSTFNTVIKEPSLKCILNRRYDYDKTMYEYSDIYHVNRDICRIYCSDSVEYYIADKVAEESGGTFMYDVRTAAGMDGVFGSSNHKFTSFVREKRTCVSEIYYNNPIPGDSIINLRRTYGLSDTELPLSTRNTPTNWKTLFKALVDKAATERNRGEVVNQVVYDLLNCNLYAAFDNDGNFKAGNQIVYRPTNYETAQAAIKSIQSELANSFDIEYKQNVLSYDFAAEDMNSSEMLPVSMGKERKVGNSFMNNSGQILTPVENELPIYCNGANCFKYVSATDVNNYKMPTGHKNRTTAISNIKSISNLDISFNGTAQIPTNDYAFFEASVTVGMYNNSRFQYEPITGDIKTSSSTSNLLELDAYRYPVNKNAYNICYSNSSTSNRSRCTIYHQLSVPTFQRNVSDEFSTAVADHQTFSCYVYVKKPPTCTVNCGPGGVNADYRTIDPERPFPNGRANTIWDNEVGAAAEAQIIRDADKLRPVEGSLIEYSIVLSPTQIKDLAEYSKNSGVAYYNEPIINETCQIDRVNNIYVNCSSEFLNMLREDDKYGDLQFDAKARNNQGGGGGGGGGQYNFVRE